MQKPNFEKTPLAAAVAVALGATTSPAVAQESSTEVMEEIVTTGIRGSLRQSMDVKRQSDGVVDAINAEDIGNFPDSNLAESLQRITGVSIERERGEGGRVTVRGFGPQFNLVLLNGRQMPTSGGVFGAPQGVDRSFDFGNLASEAVSSVNVFKSGKADVPTGGIGSTIDIRTTRPLENPGLNMTFAASGVYDESRTKRESTDWTGEVSGLFSNTFADDKVGIALSIVRQDRSHGSATANVGGWRTFNGASNSSWGVAPGACNNAGAPADVSAFVGQETWGGIPVPCFDWEGEQVNRPDADDLYSVPQTIGYNLSDYDRTRTNGQLTLQFRPVEAVTATLDYVYSEREEERTYNDLSAWFNFGGQSTVWPDGDNVTPETYSEGSAGSDYSMGAGEDAFKNENNSIGLNLLWDVSDSLSLEFDYHDSSAESGPGSKWGNSALISVAAYTRDVTTGYFGKELPILELGLSNSLTPDDMQITGSVFQNQPSRMDIEQTRLGGSFFVDGGFIESIDFGVQFTDVENQSQQATVQRDSWSAQTPIGAIADLMTPASMAGAFSNVPGSGDDRRQLDYFTYDMSDLIERAEQLIASGDMPIFVPGNGDLGPCGTALCRSDDFTTDRRTLEESQSAYFQVNMATEWGNFPVSMRAGVRYEQTDVTSRALVPEYNGLLWVGGNELSPQTTGTSAFTKLTGDYDYWLPNFDLKMDVTENIVGRFSYSQTLTRPNYTDIQGGVTIDSPVRLTEGTGNRGNPALLPYESENLDLSFEYYYGEGSYLSVGYFRKDVSNFIGTSSVTETVFDLPHPGLGPLADAARAGGASTPGEIFDWILVNRPTDPGVDPVAGTILGIDGRDPSSPFNLTVPVNIEDATVDGWEVNLQHEFGASGFGFIVNATIVDANVGYDNNSLANQFVISGLSDSANFIPYFENDNWSVRVAYNWRDAFLAGTGQTNIGAGPPTYVDEYGQWDISASYWATDNLQIFTDIINLTDETSYVYGRQTDQILFASQYGTRYTLGVRYKF
jgi:TonB-dependent receptor